MVKINYCPSCGAELIEGSFICPLCNVDVEELFAKGYLLGSNNDENSIELFKADEEMILVDDNPELGINSADEIVIVLPADAKDGEIVVDFDKLGIDVENLDENVNIVIEVDGMDLEDEGDTVFDDELPPNEWFFNDDPYEIVYYEFVNRGD